MIIVFEMSLWRIDPSTRQRGENKMKNIMQINV